MAECRVSTHEVADLKGRLLASADAIEDGTPVVVEARQKMPEGGSADAIDNGAELRRCIKPRAVGRDDGLVDTQRFGQCHLALAPQQCCDMRLP